VALRRGATHAGQRPPLGGACRGAQRTRPGCRAALSHQRGPGPPEVTRFDPTAQFKEAYREGSIREKGTVTVAGRRARRLVIEHDPQTVVDLKLVVRSSRTIALFDAQTTEPIEFIDESVIEADGQRGTVVLHTRYATFEKLPRTPENLAKLRMSKKP